MAEWVDAGKVGITPKGEFDLSTAYEKNDLVSYQSYAFLCQQNCTGIAPVIGTVTEYWQPFGSSVEGDNTTTEIVDGKITVKDYVSKTEVDGISGDVTDLSDTVDAVIEQIGTEEELANLPNPAESLAANITQINSNLTDSGTYSNNEVVVGKYMGKTLYRRVIVGTTSSSQDTRTNLNTTVTEFVTVNGFLTASDGMQYPIGWYYSSDDYVLALCSTKDYSSTPNSVRIRVPSAYRNGRPYKLVVEYIKD